MSKADRNVKLTPGLRRKFCSNMLTVGGRAMPDIRCDIQNGASNAGKGLLYPMNCLDPLIDANHIKSKR